MLFLRCACTAELETTMTMPNPDPYATLTKPQLRASCKEARVKNWGAMSNEKMRRALKARDRAQEERPTTANTVADGEVPAKVKRAAKKAADAAARAGKGGKMSVRDWIAQRLAKGKLSLADAVAYAESSGRS